MLLFCILLVEPVFSHLENFTFKLLNVLTGYLGGKLIFQSIQVVFNFTFKLRKKIIVKQAVKFSLNYVLTIIPKEIFYQQNTAVLARQSEYKTFFFMIVIDGGTIRN
ncbi:hypothetical protein BpHYR1_012762 [Brachionus plicatilis]|uniref:Uncharacterized protein n=1 Tax=Brachionus plicatilis TaxID=10195 RepID=A0A3M7STJ1_BRAPC|nr:hypothetical protein BpHYR1_012762 [Brachionus plicatilis]